MFVLCSLDSIWSSSYDNGPNGWRSGGGDRRGQSEVGSDAAVAGAGGDGSTQAAGGSGRGLMMSSIGYMHGRNCNRRPGMDEYLLGTYDNETKGSARHRSTVFFFLKSIEFLTVRFALRFVLQPTSICVSSEDSTKIQRVKVWVWVHRNPRL